MQNNRNQFSMEDALKLASTPAGRELIALLQSAGGQDVEKAKQAAQKGDYTQAKNSLAEIMKSPKVQQLLREMEKNNG